MKLEQPRPDVFTVTLTSHELAALTAAARLALAVMRDDPSAPPDAVAALEHVLAGYDAARARLAAGGSQG